MEIENIVTPCGSPPRSIKGSPGADTVVLNYIEDVNIVVKETLTDIVNRVIGKNTFVNVGQKRKCVSCEEEINKRQKLEEENITLKDRLTELEKKHICGHSGFWFGMGARHLIVVWRSFFV